MNLLTGYQLNERLHLGQRFATFRAVRLEDERSVVLKVPSRTRPLLRDIACLKHEYEMCSLLDLPGIIRVLALEESAGNLALVMEDFGGQSLAHSSRHTLELVSFCRMAIRITEALAHVHAAGVVHKDLKPSNILIKPGTLDLRLSGFGIASRLSRESTSSRGPEWLEGTLAYMSPEQTGRMNRSIDHRSDLYSLGATFYELLTGRTPFEAEDPLELVHCHIARQPTPPHELQASIPPALSRLVMKLLEKMAEHRYQTALGVKAHLERCLAALELGEQLPDFSLDASDVSQQFRIPQRLYGRQEQVTTLMQAFERVAAGEKEALLISGYAGIGKSVLVGEVNRPIASRRGYFVSGKFDQFRRDLPYSAFLQCFRELTQRLLSESPDRVAAWKERLLNALAPDAQVVIEVVPEVELLIGPQPPAVELGPNESEIRFNHVVRQFVRVLATAEHPLALFLDDLHWADSASLRLLRLLLTDPSLSHLLVICAYRDNEVDAAHPFTDTLSELRRQGASMSSIALGPLALEHVAELVADTLHVSPERAHPLAEIVLAKTGGNPFFIGQFLTTLHRKRLLSFHSREGAWDWNLEAIRGEDITDNVGALLSARLTTLVEGSRRVLQLAACIGARFDLRTLALASEQSPSEVAASLEEPLRAELVLPLDEAYKYSEFVRADGTADVPAIGYCFVHDRVQQAAYHSIPEEERPALHQRIGRLLLRGAGAQEDEHLFDIVSHLNAALGLITTEAERYELAEMNLRAGRKAKRSSAHGPAARLLETGLALLPGDAWETHHTLAFSLNLEAAETAYLDGRYEEMERLADLLLKRSRSDRQRVRVLELKLYRCSSQMLWSRCIELGLKALRMLGERLPARPSKADVVLALGRTKWMLRDHSPESLRALPEMKDEDRLAAMRILRLIGSAAYFSLPDLFPLITFRMVQLSIRWGNTGLSSYAFVLYGLILCSVLGDYDGGYAFGRLGMELLERFRAREQTATLVMLFSVFIRHWKEAMAPTVPELLNAAQMGLETGDLEYFSYCHFWASIHALVTGEPLDLLRERVDRSYTTVYRQKQEKGQGVMLHLRHLLDTLQLPVAGRAPPEGDMDEQQIIKRWRHAGDNNALCYAYGFQGMGRFFAGDPKGCLEHMAACERYAEAMVGQSVQPLYAFYQALSLLALALQQPASDRRQALRKVELIRKHFVKWARHAPANYAHKLHLLDAELGRLRQRPAEEVEREYIQAIALAQSGGCIQDEALAHELLAQHLFERGLQEAATTYLTQAHRLYESWGATARCALLQQRHPDLLMLGTKGARGVDTDILSSAGSTSVEALDLQWILRATQALSGKLVLGELVQQLIRLILECAGAGRGALLLEREGVLMLAAETALGGQESFVRQPRPLDGTEPLPAMIIHYCFHSGEPLVLKDATQDVRFASDPYVASARPRSVLCAPIVHQGKTEGIIYLENPLTTGAFTPNRLETVQMLASQAGVSLRNAMLYLDLEHSLEAQVQLTTAHSRFVPHQFLRSLNRRNIVDVRLGDYVQKEISIFFSDIRGFTPLMEALPASDALAFINQYIGYIEPPLIEAGGFIDSYNGDGVMALFDGSADSAVQGAIAMHRALERYNEERQRQGLKPVRTGIGINTGTVMLGTIGGRNRLKCGVIGDAVNLASRVEGLTKVYGAVLLITEFTYERLEEPSRYSIRRIEPVRVVGKQRPVTLYEVFDADPPGTRAAKERTLGTFRQAQERYVARDFAGALALLEQCLELCPEDVAAALFAERCRRFLHEGVPADWDGVERLTRK
ncbi:AAA family ATPase [Corallococcus sp. M7]